MKTMTKKSLKGKTCKCLMVIRGKTIEDIPAMREAIKNAIKDKPETILNETDTTFELNNGQFWFKPRRHRETLGQITFSPTFVDFDGMRIEYKELKITGTGILTDFAEYVLM